MNILQQENAELKMASPEHALYKRIQELWLSIYSLKLFLFQLIICVTLLTVLDRGKPKLSDPDFHYHSFRDQNCPRPGVGSD